MGNRQGQRTDIKKPELRPEMDKVERGKRTDEIAAKSVGWGKSTYHQAKTVIESGNEEVIQQMDSGELFLYGGLFFS